MKRTILALALFLTASSMSFATEFKALLVGIEDYEIAPLDFIRNDVTQFTGILMERYDCQVQMVINTTQMCEGIPRISIMERIEHWCGSLGTNDTALLYISGHGVRDETGKLYLAMTNFNRRNFDAAAIPIEWIRDQFGKSAGRNKLLLIDTCFAGTAKSIDFEQATSDEVTAVFADMKDVAIIASSRGDEKSWIWNDAKHSLFTYWLIEAFKGHADLDGDRFITIGELVEYLQDNVPWIANTTLGQDQNPVVINELAGADFNLPLRAIALRRLIDDVAEQIDLQVRLGNFARIGIPEFTTGNDQTFDARYGALPRNIAEDLRNALARRAQRNRSGYSVLSENALREVLHSKGITPSDLGTAKTRNMQIGGEEIPVLVDGQLLMCNAGSISLRVCLVATSEGGQVGQAGGAAILNSNELAKSGISAKFVAVAELPAPEREPRLIPNPSAGLVSPGQRAEVQRMQEAAMLPHPLETTSNNNATGGTFDVWIETRPIGRGNYTRRPFIFQDNDCFIPLSNGEEYQIVFKVESSEDVFVKVLVDGLNTLSQQQPGITTRGLYVEAIDPDGEGASVVAPRVSLDDARPWVVPQRARESTFAVPGFFDVSGRADTVRRFQIVDADESMGARKNYTEQIGLITVAFYKAVTPSAGTRGGFRIGTDGGPAERTRVERYAGDKVPGEMIAVYNIRYMTPEMLAQTVEGYVIPASTRATTPAVRQPAPGLRRR